MTESDDRRACSCFGSRLVATGAKAETKREKPPAGCVEAAMQRTSGWRHKRGKQSLPVESVSLPSRNKAAEIAGELKGQRIPSELAATRLDRQPVARRTFARLSLLSGSIAYVRVRIASRCDDREASERENDRRQRANGKEGFVGHEAEQGELRAASIAKKMARMEAQPS